MLIVAATIASAAPRARAARARAAAPSVVVIVTDDQRWDALSPTWTPSVAADLIANGTTYPNAFVSNPLCCPSRTAILTGTYSHTSGVFTNFGSNGGWRGFRSNGNATDTVATDFHRAGYRTAMIGKFLNGFPDRNHVPPGWDTWFSVPTHSYYDYTVNADGTPRRFGTAPPDYSTRVISHQARAFIEAGGPFFLYVAPTSPHSPAISDPRDAQRFEIDPPNTPSRGVVAPDQPRYLREHLSEWDETSSNAFARRQINSAYGADRLVGQLWEDAPDGTIFVYLSDNGLLWGEHGWTSKAVPYNESLRIPFVVATKGVTAPAVDPRFVLNVDVRASVAALAGLPVPRTEGRPLTAKPRQVFVIEHAGRPGAPPTAVPTYCGFRSHAWLYVRYATGEEEVYDEVRDPFELDNLADTIDLAPFRARASTLCTGGAHYPPDWPTWPAA
jgi:arylsulfatase A-like enzyme